MKATKRYRPLFRLWFTRSHAADVDEEFQFHLTMRAAELERHGYAPARAREIALAQFGDINDARRFCRAEDERRMREYRKTLHLDNVRQDIVVAFRAMRRQPAFAFSTILTLGIAIALATSAYGVMHAYIVRPLPYPDADRVVRVRPTPTADPFPNAPRLAGVDWSIGDSVFATTVEWDLDAFTVVGSDRSESVYGAWVSPGYFTALGLRPAVGRSFTTSEFTTNQPIAIISDALWSRQYNRDPSIIGRTVRIQSSERANGAEQVTIVGVMPRDAWHIDRFTDVLRPQSTRLFPGMAVLRPGMSMREAEDRLNAIVRPLISGTIDPAWRMSLVGVQEAYTFRIKPTLVALVGGAVFLLLIAGASVAGAQTARAAARRAEIQIRTALGASRGRIIMQLVTESLVIAAAAATIGAIVAGAVLATFGSLVGRQLGAAIPGGDNRLALGTGILALVIALGSALGAAFGLLPALAMTRSAVKQHGLGSSLGSGKGTARSATSPVLRRGLIVAQVAFTMMLLIGAGLMGRTILAITTTPLGFTDEHVVKGDMFLPSARYPDAAKHRAGAERVLEAVTSDPAIRGAALSFPDPFRTFSVSPSRVITDRGHTPADSGRPAAGFLVTPSYFAVMEIPLVAGRAFASTDDAAAPRVVIVSQRLASALWPNEAAVGQRVRTAGDSVWATVVGVVSEIREPVEATPMPEIYWHLPQDPVPLFTVLARVSGDPADAGPTLQRAVARADNLLGIGNIGPLTELTDRAMRRHRALASVLSLFALLALGLAMLGLYASLAYVVAQRRREIAIRVAVGANAWAIRSLVLREGVALVGVGLLLGIALSLALTRLIASQLYGVTPTDPGTFGAIVALLGASALVASLAPIRQATRVQPAEIMRSD